jgi:hypothetical protein
MNPILLGVLGDVVKNVISRVWPDPEKQAQAQLELAKLAQAGEFKQVEVDLALALGQMEINKVEAANNSVWVSGWRPAAGWAAVSGLFYQVFVRPIAGWIMEELFLWSQPPSLEIESLMTLLFGMLGLGAYRTYEKTKGVAR